MTDTATTPSKLHTYEVWAAKILAAALSGCYATGIIPTSGPAVQVAAIAATVLGYLGFTVLRGKQASS